MIKRELKDCKVHEMPGHFKMVALRIHGREESGAKKFWMSMSHFLPGGGADWGYEDNPLEKMYFVLEGQITVRTMNKEYVLDKWDSIFIGPNEGREIINNTNKPASMLVVINYPD
jgi:glyoxylate utilization-related uncharacterized protein